ncbi:MAG TPA: hypothetical protein VN541_02205, partial [Tepidisphaeraceae bacterium]|nr:hypothetical protein [Tepidisphaeraceae bacterium]
VLDEPVDLPEGTDVEVEVRPAAEAQEQEPTWAEVFGDLAGSLSGLPPDLAENHDHYAHGAPKGADKR